MGKKTRKIMLVAGARPNFMKIAPLMAELAKHKERFDLSLIHTGQHYDFKMSDIFFSDLNIPSPDVHLNVGPGSHAAQTARIMDAFEKAVLEKRPDLVVVVGDVNSTLACSLVASKLNTKVAHVEAGLRSFDRTMPEEINRIVTDSLSDYLFVTEASGMENLKAEGVDGKKVHFVGNVMIDTLLANIEKFGISPILERLGLERKKYAVLTLHRPVNVDSRKALGEVYDILAYVTGKVGVVYPIHPRTEKMIAEHGFLEAFKDLRGLTMIKPLGYIDFIKLVKESRFVLTDSGGIQEESTVMNAPCLTMRENTERPVTIEKGGNRLVGRDKEKIRSGVEAILKGETRVNGAPELWDGKAAGRIAKILLEES